MCHKTYINQIGRNLLGCVVELPKEMLPLKVSISDIVNDKLEIADLEKLRNFYMGIYRTLSEIKPEMINLPDFEEVHPVDKKKYDKCVDRVIRILIVLYAIGFTGKYIGDGLIEVDKESLWDLCKKLKVSALDSVLQELNRIGVSIGKKDDSKLKINFMNDDSGIIAKYHCIYTKTICKDNPEDTKLISSYFRCDFSLLFNTKPKKNTLKEESSIAAVLPKDKADMLNELFSILKEEMDCRTEVKAPVYKDVIKGSFSAAFKHRKTGRTLVSLDVKSGDIILRLNFTTETLGKVFQLTNEYPSEVFDNIRRCRCKGNECMGHEGVYIPEADMNFCSHIIKYEIRSWEKSTFIDFTRLLRAQYGFLVEPLGAVAH